MRRKAKIILALSVCFSVFYAIIVCFLWHILKNTDIISVIALIVSLSALYIVFIKGVYRMFSEWIGFEQPILMPIFYLDEKGDRCNVGVINEGNIPSKSACIRYLIGDRLSDLIPIYPHAGGHVYYPGVKRGTWELPKGVLLPNKLDGKSVIISVETKTYDTFFNRMYCTCRTFISNGQAWIPKLDKDRRTEPYFWRFKRCKNCLFEGTSRKMNIELERGDIQIDLIAHDFKYSNKKEVWPIKELLEKLRRN